MNLLDCLFLRPLRRAIHRKPVINPPRILGNKPCPCGAVDEKGRPKKFKNCHSPRHTGIIETREHYNMKPPALPVEEKDLEKVT
jgi:hypothetical protein